MKTRDTNPAGVRTIKASEFKARCLKLMDEVADNGAEIVITKNGRPVSRLIPWRKKPDTLSASGPWSSPISMPIRRIA